MGVLLMRGVSGRIELEGISWGIFLGGTGEKEGNLQPKYTSGLAAHVMSFCGIDADGVALHGESYSSSIWISLP